jgi:hypothetical protein
VRARLEALSPGSVHSARGHKPRNEAQAERVAARGELENASVPDLVADAEIYAMIDSLGDVGLTLADAMPTSLSRLYQQLRLQLRYEPDERAVYVAARPRVVSASVRGGSCALTTRLTCLARAEQS